MVPKNSQNGCADFIIALSCAGSAPGMVNLRCRVLTTLAPSGILILLGPFPIPARSPSTRGSPGGSARLTSSGLIVTRQEVTRDRSLHLDDPERPQGFH